MRKRIPAFLLSLLMTTSMVVTASAVDGGQKDVVVNINGITTSNVKVYGATIEWEEPTFNYNVDGEATARWDPDTHTYSTGSAISGSFDKTSVAVKVYNHSNAKIDASCFVGADTNSATSANYKVSGYDVSLSVSNPDGNAVTLPAAAVGSDVESVNTTFTLGISGSGMDQYATDLVARATTGVKIGTVVVVIGETPLPAAPTLAANSTWYKGTIGKDTVTSISIVDEYTPTGSETESWDASDAGDGSVMGYLNGTDVIIAGNGAGTVKANMDSLNTFRSFSAVTTISGLDKMDTSEVTTMGSMFSGCKSLISIGNVTGWNTSNVENFSGMFMSCSALTALDLSGWDTSNMRDIFSMSYIFYSCSSLKSLNLSGWTTPDDIACPVVTFTGCVRLQKVTVSPTFVFFYQYDIERILPEPSPEYITGADGKWYDTATGIGYTPMELCDVSRTGDVTYTAIKPQA